MTAQNFFNLILRKIILVNVKFLLRHQIIVMHSVIEVIQLFSFAYLLMGIQ